MIFYRMIFYLSIQASRFELSTYHLPCCQCLFAVFAYHTQYSNWIHLCAYLVFLPLCVSVGVFMVFNTVGIGHSVLLQKYSECSTDYLSFNMMRIIYIFFGWDGMRAWRRFCRKFSRRIFWNNFAPFSETTEVGVVRKTARLDYFAGTDNLLRLTIKKIAKFLQNVKKVSSFNDLRTKRPFAEHYPPPPPPSLKPTHALLKDVTSINEYYFWPSWNLLLTSNA